ncbi:uracil-DNA glycosylase [Pseudohaliea rubra]|uniref:Uracil-DNA glycosylase n=1 Tax=Pseudohaliea rubra DSM 19751 TaxID=1265313 RepID=A0A095VPE5_9GAMM|nr:uracil-DNA glycosylase [Pseudohaliea rubra]KGE03342.1 Uracil-DNA glycosylase, family 1 [Pseudohaliea rubra DSM 19751]
MDERSIHLEPGWLALLRDEFEQPYTRQLSAFLRERRRAGRRIFPPGPELFNAFWYTPPERVSVVILGQDPYHGPGQAHGLCFSVRPGVPVPPSLRNIYRERHDDLGIAPADHGSLVAWARRGVLLLNSVLTVEEGKAGAHQGKGWERFTDRVIAILNNGDRGLVFMLWGSYAQKKGAQIDERRHCVLRAPHPSPLSAHRGFLGCRHFSQGNAWLAARGAVPVDWRLPPLAEAERLVAQPASSG